MSHEIRVETVTVIDSQYSTTQAKLIGAVLDQNFRPGMEAASANGSSLAGFEGFLQRKLAAQGFSTNVSAVLMRSPPTLVVSVVRSLGANA